jgi:hypothetical protein
MDPNYYSPYEVSYRFHGAFSPVANHARDFVEIYAHVGVFDPEQVRIVTAAFDQTWQAVQETGTQKVAAKRQAWNKGLEIGKKDAFTPDQVKRIPLAA